MKITEILSEAPLNDFDAFGDLETPGSFQSDDLKAIRNPKWREKVFKAFSKTPFNFNIYVYNGVDGNIKMGPIVDEYGRRHNVIKANLSNLSSYAGIQPLSKIKNLIGKTIPDAKNNITVVLVENEGGARVPLTPWILAHRVCHAIGYAAEDGGPAGDREGFGFDSTLRDLLANNLVGQFEDLMRSMSMIFYNLGLDDSENTMMRMIATFRSGKTGNLANRLEFVTESMTQYLIQGRVTFERPVLTGVANMIKPKYEELRDLASQMNIDDFIVKVMGETKPEHGVASAFRKERERHLRDAYKAWNDLGWLRPGATFGDRSPNQELHDLLDRYERSFNSTITAIFKACVGKALIL